MARISTPPCSNRSSCCRTGAACMPRCWRRSTCGAGTCRP
ncbi:Uncharacterised protein [Bordetella pertussis]|nr:Uncharacterised protein [Bordetella pertussis]